MNYYRLVDNLYSPKNRWFLGKIDFEGEWDFWKYVRAGNVEIPSKKLTVSIRDRGIPIDFTMADFELLIVNERVVSLMDKSEVQLIPVKIKKINTLEKYHLMCITNEIECLDETRSVFKKWEENNNIRPDRAGEYKSITKLHINSDAVHNINIFRLKHFDSAIIISEILKEQFERNNISGIKFIGVS